MPYRRGVNEAFDPGLHELSTDGKSWVLKSAIENDKRAEEEAKMRNQERGKIKKIFGIGKESGIDVLHEEEILEEFGNLSLKNTTETKSFQTTQAGLGATVITSFDVDYPYICGSFKGENIKIYKDPGFESVIGKRKISAKKAQILFEKLYEKVTLATDLQKQKNKRLKGRKELKELPKHKDEE